MENLFSDDPQFRRVQYKKLSDNPKEWQQEIGALVAEALPKDMGLSVTVVFQNVDDEKGYAIGSAIATNPSSDKTIGIPLVVKAWHLAPLDIFFQDKVLYPLTDDNVAKAFFQTGVGMGVATKKPPPNMADDIFADVRTPPLGGKYTYSAPFSALNLISGTIGADDLEHFKLAVHSNPTALGGFHKNGTFDLLCKYASEKPAPDPQDQVNKERALGAFTVKKNAPNKYSIYSALDGVYDPILVSTDRQGLKHFLEMRTADLDDFGQDPLGTIDRYGHFTLSSPKGVYGLDVDGPSGAVKTDGAGDYAAELGKHKNPWVFDPRQDDRVVRTIDRFGRYGVKDADGVMAKGWVLPNVIDFDGNVKPHKLFLGKSLCSVQGRIAGIPLHDDDDTNLVADTPDSGKTGTMVYRKGERVLATAPFQVTGVTVYKGMRALSVVDFQGNQANLIISPSIDGIVPLKPGSNPELEPLLGPKKNYIMSQKMFFVRMPRLCPVSEGPDDFKSKAAEYLDKNPLKIAHANGLYVFRGGQVAKYAAHRDGWAKTAQYGVRPDFDFNHLKRHEAEFVLASWGLGHNKIAEALDGSHNRLQIEVHHLRFPPFPEMRKQAGRRRRDAIANMRPSIPALVKHAASLENAQTVDSVLSLGFVNEENIRRFAAAKPMLEEVSHVLAKLLLASRIAMEDIPEESVRYALIHLQRVIDGLGKLKMMEGETEKTSSVRDHFAGSFSGGRLMTQFAPIGITR